MNKPVSCPICLDAEGGSCRELPSMGDSSGYNCEVCGPYRVSRRVVTIYLSQDGGRYLSPRGIERALLSHRLRGISSESRPFLIDTYWLDNVFSNGRLPSPAQQAANIVRFIGDDVSTSGESIYQLPKAFHAIVGALNRNMAFGLLKELAERRILTIGSTSKTPSGNRELCTINLTLDGWEQYEAEKRGNFGGNYGFMAMQFDDCNLDPFVRDVVKPTVKDALGYELVDMRDVARAGVIDNIMRAQIRDAAFVIVDLTHDNPGAYWEAGYAEGLGKPVIYICEEEKFEAKRTHFDTNHCTTVPWSQKDNSIFRQALIATLRRSLDLPS